MLELSELLESYVHGVRRLSGADAVSLFVPPPSGGLLGALLVHDGDVEPLAELVDHKAAFAFLEAVAAEVSPSAGTSASSRLRARPSESGDGTLVPLPSVHAALSSSDRQEGEVDDESERFGRRRRDGSEKEGAFIPTAWLGLRFLGKGAESRKSWSPALPFGIGESDDPETWWEWLFSIGGALAGHTSQVSAILRDPVTGLPNRSGFQTALAEEIEQARAGSTCLALLMVNPDDFAAINERFGREAGDGVVAEISRRLRSSLRASDALSRFGGVIFAITLVDISLDLATQLALKVQERLSEAAYLDGAVRLGFSVGIAMFDPEDAELRSPLDVIRRADQALNAAKRQGGGRVADWERGVGLEESGNFDRLSGIFTGNMSKDYRNMVLLSDAIDVISVNHEFGGLAAEVVEKLYQTFHPDRVGLFVGGSGDDLELVRGVTRRPVRDGSSQSRVETVELEESSLELIRSAMADGEPRQRVSRALGCYAIPLATSEGPIACFYLDGREAVLRLERSDLIFLRALASQLAVALDRARLAELERGRREVERRELKAELNDLRHALQQSRMVYRSQQMEDLVARTRRVAPTDATVLILGESGTGKELLARALHELSPRRKKPLVVVDCGSISSSLIESELFGHEKGAFTGAQQRRVGRLADAADGTVLLDEMGELPLEVQSKLLRFVQEKQFTTVGGTRPTSVDVRIVVATHRDLAAEVEAGRFREDLYHRLNVVRLDVPPLRERPDDILYLARHFLESYVIQYQKNVQLTSEAEEAMLRHPWPGNVRELQNRVMQAVILSEGDELGPEELKLDDVAGSGNVAGSANADLASYPGPAARLRAFGGRQESLERGLRLGDSAVALSSDAAWHDLRRALRLQVAAVADAGPRSALPLGKWVSEDLVLQADAAEGGNSRRAARLLGLAATTFRRRLEKADENATAGLDVRAQGWSEVRTALKQILAAPGCSDTDTNLLSRAGRELLAEILEQFPSDGRTGAVLLGVSLPTFRRRVSDVTGGHASLEGAEPVRL